MSMQLQEQSSICECGLPMTIRAWREHPSEPDRYEWYCQKCERESYERMAKGTKAKP